MAQAPLDLTSHRRIVVLTGTVSPAAHFVRSAEYAGARTIFINLERLDPPNPMFHESYLGRAEELVPQLLGV